MTRGRRKAEQKKWANFVICHPVSSSSGLYPSPFRPSPIFRRPLFMCFSATASRQRRELPMRQWASFHPFSSPLRFFCRKLLRVTRKEVAHPRIKCQIFWKCKQVESPSIPISRGTDLPFSHRFSASRKFRGLNRETPWPGSMKRTRAKLTLSNE
jgi:hypothetical protein